MKTKNTYKNILLLLAVIALTVFPLVYVSGAEFGGADGQAEAVIANINPGYQPWFSSIWSPPSGEIESLLFALQGALGAGVICYYLGYKKGKKKAEKD
ncbi:energy-coupling factor ABC transporter substrate-binding protein [Desulfoscipio geothermicus]|jgi:cobalt/nickel transport protein|uniref:Cobalt transport protein CbiN n=1 Tax=Desulfoscipio geothermicus DSM 3669 TaxID=1121426 RepID=A0A1I6DPR0_9FIRM|nr:energy-coupling factor ABC transporter substrate-binding protein [Desulfoscipio geothermicus]SFR07450.1 cobalt/nickel transport protein [Desulfoscipio geothermicus DSM 3669]